jgi:hypothetical protein
MRAVIQASLSAAEQTALASERQNQVEALAGAEGRAPMEAASAAGGS